MSNLPPIEVPQGAIRLNTDSQRLEFFAQDRWYEMATDFPYLGGNGNASTDPTGNSSDKSAGSRGIFTLHTSAIDYITIPSAGDSVVFGVLSSTRNNAAALASLVSTTSEWNLSLNKFTISTLPQLRFGGS